jgi:hypothetical protein
MQIKHSFLLTLILGLAWTGYLFGYVLGPEPAMNGIFSSSQTCATAGCHTGNPVNAAGGSLTISGLPTSTGWTPGQIYPLTITIARTGQRLFGFQLSAVADATNQQAGTLAAGNGRVQIICGRGTSSQSTQQVSCTTAGAIQYAEHSNAQVATSTYTVNWTAPSSASVGTVRFNLAGNAANGDISNQGDFIYTRVDRVDAAASAPPTDLSVRAFTMVDRGGSSVITDGSGALSLGYSRIQPASGSTTPAGVAIFGFRQSGTLVTEAGVPASPLMTSARIYAEVAGAVNTGLAIANPNSTPATITFHFTDAGGIDFGGSSTVIEPNQQIAKFLNEAPYNGLASRTSVQGTFSLTSNVPVSVIALRGFFNERTLSEFLITTLPVTDPTASSGAGTVYLPHYADGAGWKTQIVLVNPTDSTITGTVQFYSQGTVSAPGAPISVTANGLVATSFTYSIPRQSSFKLVTAGVAAATASGSVRVTSVTGVAPSSLVVFSYKPGQFTLSEAGVPGIQGTAFRMYAEETATGGIGAIQTGLAIANLAAAAVTVNLELTRLDGTASLSTTRAVPGNGQVVGFLHDFFPALTFPFQGLLRISGGTAGLSAVGLRSRYNERGDFLITTTPPSNENASSSSAELLFPHLVNGGGYTTQFILFSGTTGQASSGNLKFLKQDGTDFSLTVN